MNKVISLFLIVLSGLFIFSITDAEFLMDKIEFKEDNDISKWLQE